MLLFLKSTSSSSSPSSRTVHHCQDDDEEEIKQQEHSCSSSSITSLTVWRKSLVFSCKGFTVIGSDGSLVYRVDNYTGHPHHIVLMDGSGNPIFTICRRKKLRLVDNCWLVYEGELGDNTISKKPIYCVKKSTGIMRTRSEGVLAYVHEHDDDGVSQKGYSYMIQGSYAQRCCKILDEKRRAVAEIKRKEALIGGVSFGLEVFHLIVMPWIDSRFAMALVLLLDQMFS